jgi:hypothetical protein
LARGADVGARQAGYGGQAGVCGGAALFLEARFEGLYVATTHDASDFAGGDSVLEGNAH